MLRIRNEPKRNFDCSKTSDNIWISWILLFFTEIGRSGPAKRWLWIVLSVFITLQGISVVLSQVIGLESFSKLSRMFLRIREEKVNGTSDAHVSMTQNSQL
ncbi:hypothetical protein EB796_016816 [Bugula neritina]|uniref:Uncharacterized protein n=1 Tax=Bugula neritina TaxID=10212 RepID=A0A7J7JGC9_BUGNE|nr:hypothetical protein EB796_016816 [Bugula neritina]